MNHIYTVVSLKQESTESPCSASAGHDSELSPLCTYLQMTSKGTASTDLEITNTFQGVGKFTTTELSNNED